MEIIKNVLAVIGALWIALTLFFAMVDRARAGSGR